VLRCGEYHYRGDELGPSNRARAPDTNAKRLSLSTLVTISGSYGAGGSRVGPALAERLGVPFLDRAIPAAVAEELAVPFDDAEAHDEQLNASWLERMLRGFILQDIATPSATLSADATDDFRKATEEVLLRQAATGRGVILGRGAAVLLRDDERVLRVRLDGPPERRVLQAMELEGIDEATARQRQRRQDHAHQIYTKHFYGRDISDPLLYHVTLDSTAIALDVCVELLEAAARSMPVAGVPEAAAGRDAEG
jgi:cytidylate kinase